MKQSRKDCNGSRTDSGLVNNTGAGSAVCDTAGGGMGDIDTSPVPTSTPGSGTSSPWGAASSSHRGSSKSGPARRCTPSTPSDCTTMSADSPVSRQSNQQQQQIIATHNGVSGTVSVRCVLCMRVHIIGTVADDECCAEVGEQTKQSECQLSTTSTTATSDSYTSSTICNCHPSTTSHHRLPNTGRPLAYARTYITHTHSHTLIT